MRTQEQQHALSLLRKMGRKDSKPFDQFTGICGNIFNLMRWDLRQVFPTYYEIIRKWKHFSGNYMFPVPSKILTPTLAYCTLPLWSGEYGKMRRKFARYLYREFSKQYPAR